MDEDFIGNIEIDLNEHFADPDGDELIYSVEIEDEIAEVEIENSILIISALEDIFGITNITVTADDNVTRSIRANSISRDICETSFSLTVNAVNDAPEIISFSPEELQFEITEDQEIIFEVIAEDIDSVLEYTWFVNQENVNNPDSTFTYYFAESNEYEIKCVVNDEEFELETIWDITVNITGINNNNLMPLETKLIRNYPNPFNPITTIGFNIKEGELGTFTIFNIKGQIIVNNTFEAGVHSYKWNAAKNASGIYFYKLHTKSYLKINKMIMLK